MTQTPQEKPEKGRFVQFPVHLIYGCSGLTRDDKWVLLAIMGECWADGPYRLSYREIASIAGVPLSLLSSYEDKSGKHHEGIMERIERVTSYICVAMGKEMNATTGKPRGNAQSYITINHSRIWQDNLAYCEARKQRSNTPQDYQPVSNTNRLVSNTNTSVQYENTPVSNTNEGVSIVNEPVSNLPSETTPYITKIDSDITDSTEEESEGEQSDTATCAPSLPLDAALSPQSEIDTLPDGDYIIIERLPGGGQKIRRASGKPIGELIPIGMDTSEGLQNLVTVTATLSLSDTYSQQGDAHGSADNDMVDMALDHAQHLPSVPDCRSDEQAQVTEAAPEIDEEWCNAETEHRLPAIPKSVVPPSGTSHEQNRDASPRNVAVEADLGVASSVPIPPVPPEASPPRTMRATVVSPPPQVLVVSQQFTSVEDWKQAQDAFVEQLRGIWKTTSPDFKRQSGNWNVYRKQYLDRWLRANPEPLEVQFTPDGKTLFDEWCSLFKVTVDPIKANIEAANWLAERLTTWAALLNLSRTEVLRNEKDWCYANDKNGYYKRGVKLFDLKREFEGWQSYQQSLLDKTEREKSRPQNKYGTVSGLPHLEPSQEWLEAMGGR